MLFLYSVLREEPLEAGRTKNKQTNSDAKSFGDLFVESCPWFTVPGLQYIPEGIILSHAGYASLKGNSRYVEGCQTVGDEVHTFCHNEQRTKRKKATHSTFNILPMILSFDKYFLTHCTT